MVRKVKILDADTNQELRQEYASIEKTVLGIRLGDIIKAIPLVFLCGIFYANQQTTNQRIDNNQTVLSKSIEKLIEFNKTSDSWHSTVWGTQFEGGKPIDGSFRPRNYEVR